MTGNEILSSAAALIGFKTPTSEMNEIAITVINSVLEDISKPPLTSLSATAEDLDQKEEQACLYGTALLLSIAIGDLRSKECFSPIYNEKRGRVKRSKSYVTDALPKGELL